jgi:hypothetical protein
MLGGEIFWQTHLLVPVAEIMENPKRANHSVEVRVLPQQLIHATCIYNENVGW